MPDRDALLSRIDARFDAMMAAGALDEVRALAARRLNPSLPAMKAHGVPWLIRHLNGEMTLAEAVEQAHATPGDIPSGRQPGSATNCRSSNGLNHNGRSPRSKRSCGRWRCEWRCRTAPRTITRVSNHAAVVLLKRTTLSSTGEIVPLRSNMAAAAALTGRL